ncbi:MAG: lipase family protein [Alphaproteobacteria bacterium]|nr:MAG: lipase family protein [Alphaproteobacteria bacterium]
MTPFEAAVAAKIAYDPAGEGWARRLGFDFQRIENRGHLAWIGRRDGERVVAFRGTTLFGRESRSYRANLSTDLVPWAGDGLVHEGYHQALWQLISAVQRAVKGEGDLVLAGHSMGAAMAVLAAPLLDARRVFAFACPRVGNRDFADGFGPGIRVVRYINRCDFLARLPFRGTVSGSDPEFQDRYVHIGRPVRLPAFGHSMNAYLSGVRQHRAGLRKTAYVQSDER